MERAPLKPPAGSTASTANESTLQKIRIDLFGDSITEKDYKKGMEQQQAGNDPGDYEYIDRLQKWPDGTPVHYYYKVPKMTAEDLKLRIAARTGKATEEAAKHTRHIKYIIIALIILGFIGGMILNQSIAKITYFF